MMQLSDMIMQCHCRLPAYSCSNLGSLKTGRTSEVQSEIGQPWSRVLNGQAPCEIWR